jgi:predicted amidophosphoribosyltransferase
VSKKERKKERERERERELMNTNFNGILLLDDIIATGSVDFREKFYV